MTEDQVRVVYGVNKDSGWGLLATVDGEQKIKHQLILICPGFAEDQEFVVALQKLAFEKMQRDGLVVGEKVEEKRGS